MEKKFEFNERYPWGNRRHVRGAGVRRDDLPNYAFLGNLSTDLIDECMKIVSSLPADYNDIGCNQIYPMSVESPLCRYFPQTYRQILLQHRETDGENEDDYRVDFHVAALERLRSCFPHPFYRARLAVLPVGTVLDWHIDTDTSVSCRIQFQIRGTSRWQINRRGNIDERVIQPGEIWFANAGFSHRVENAGDEDRVVLTVGCRYNDVSRVLGAEFSSP